MNGTASENSIQTSMIFRDELAGRSALTVTCNVADTSIVVRFTATLASKCSIP